MIKLESYGDRLKKNDYRCHSRFSKAVNFINGQSMVALVDRQIGPGPYHIIISGIDRRKVERLTIGAGELRLDGIRIPFASACRYDSGIDLGAAIDRKRFAANLEYFARGLGRSAMPKSLAFLLEPKSKRRRRSALEESIVERLSAGSKLLFGPDFFTGIKMFKGLGFGLTPGGDDFNGGVILALYCAQKIFVRDFTRTITSLHRLARGGNVFSNMVLAQAGEGRAIAKIKDMLAAILYGDKKNIRQCALRLQAIGHSSGIDFAVGMVLTFNKFIGTGGETWW